MPYGKSPTASKWHEGRYVEVYELARSGLSTANICQAIGISGPTWDKWVKKHPYLKTCLQKGRGHDGQAKATAVQNFADYVYGQLPQHLRRLWDEINACVEAPNGYERVQALLANEGYRTRQHMFIHALIDSNFNQNQALRKCGITRGTYMGWQKNDPDFIALLDEIHWYKGNFFEHALIKLVNAGETSAIIFANKTFNRDRGYAERVTVDGNVQHNHTHAHIPIPTEVLNLDLETRKKVLAAMRGVKRDEDGQVARLPRDPNGMLEGPQRAEIIDVRPVDEDGEVPDIKEVLRAGGYDAEDLVWDDEAGEPRRRGDAA